MFAQLSVDVGPENTVNTAHRMGVTSPLDAVPSITLGTSGVTPLEMADAYATLAANGVHHKPQAIVQVERRGKVIWKPSTKGNRAIPAGVASVVTQCLERVATAGTGSPYSGMYFPYPRAGKTGTTENGWDVWYDGYTPQLAAAVWMGDAKKNSPMDGAYGGTYCAPMWAKFFAAALKDQPHPSFKTFPWTFSPWKGKMQAMSPSGVPVREHQRQPEPRPDQDHHAGAAADQDADPAADADQDQDAEADAHAHGHAQRAAQAGGGGRHDVPVRPERPHQRQRHDRRRRRLRAGRRARALGRRRPGALTAAH